MFRKRLAALVALIALGVVACSGGSPNTTPVASATPSGTAISSSGQAISASGVSGITSSITVAGTGAVTASESAAPANGLPVLSSIARVNPQALKTTQAVTNTPLVYISVLATTATTITGIPASNVTFASAPTGATYLAYWTGTAWATIAGPGTVSGTTVTFASTTFGSPITIPSGASLFLAVYTGGVLVTASPTPSATASATATAAASPSPSAAPTHTASPSPSPSPTATSSGTPILADGGFENPSVAAIGSSPTISTTGWTQCTITALGPSITYSGGIKGAGVYASATAPPVPGATPTPLVGATPEASIAAAGTTVGVGTYSPVSTQTSVPVHSGSYAAQFGQVFNSYAAASYRYNGLCQTVTVPSAGGSLSGYVFEAGSESSSYVEDLFGIVTGSGNVTSTGGGLTLTSILYMENIEQSTSGTDSAYRAVGPIALQAGTQTLFIGMWTKDGASPTATSYDSSFFWVDDLNITSP